MPKMNTEYADERQSTAELVIISQERMFISGMSDESISILLSHAHNEFCIWLDE